MEMTATDEPSGRLPRHDAKHLQPQRGGIIVDFIVHGERLSQWLKWLDQDQ